MTDTDATRDLLDDTPREPPVWLCRLFGHQFEDWSGKVFTFCLRCGMRHE